MDTRADSITSAEADEVRKNIFDFRCVPDRKSHKCAGGEAKDGVWRRQGKDQQVI
jgi:hypothetical protein